MNNEQDLYNNQVPSQMGQPLMPPPPPMPPANNSVRGKVYGARTMKNVFPKWLMQYGVVVYLVALIIVNVMYSSYGLPWYYLVSGIVAIVVFFLYGSNLAEQTSVIKMRRERNFEQRILLVAFIPRVLFMLLLYWIFQANYGDAFGFDNADANYYHVQGQMFAEAIKNGRFVEEWRHANLGADISDLGYASYVGFIYTLTNDNIIIVRLLKCIWSTLTVLLIYRLAKRNFGEQTGRIAAIFVALWPNFWYYCTCHLKETEMVFLGLLFVEQADQMLRSRQFTAWKVIPVLLIGASLFTVRTPLALVAFFSLIFSLVMSSQRVVSWGKRVIVGGLALLLIGVTMGNRIEEQTRGLMDTVQSGEQKSDMEYRSVRENGNAFAKYASKSVFAPLIFTIPFPTMVRPYDGQEVQQLLNGGNFIKGIISGFTIFAMFMLLISGKWREHLLPLSFLLGYLVVLTMSNFAQSERFHQPAMPFEMMFAAYGLSIAVTKPKYKRWFMYWCGVMFVACVAWNWFKLAGRGLT